MKDNGNFPFLANQTGKFSSLMTSLQTLLWTNVPSAVKGLIQHIVVIRPTDLCKR